MPQQRSRNRPWRRLTGLFALLLALASWPQQALAQSSLRDAETEAWFNEISRPLILAAGLSPRNVQVKLLNDDSINAFVAGGQTVYIHSGLLQAADNANEVQGVIAHELGHVADGHIPLQDAGIKPAIGITLLSLVLGIAAIAAGAGEAGAGILSAGQQAAMGKFLSFSRNTEASADAAAVRYLDTAGISGRGMITFFQKLQNQEFRYQVDGSKLDPFEQTHPLSGQRIVDPDQRRREIEDVRQAVRSRDRRAVQADQGQADRLPRPARNRAQHLSRYATRASTAVTPAPTPITVAAIPTKPKPRSRAC